MKIIVVGMPWGSRGQLMSTSEEKHREASLVGLAWMPPKYSEVTSWRRKEKVATFRVN